jgi:ABC-type multidrug transport system ATPase subunit/ABC-type multidrug transport system permease subunit
VKTIPILNGVSGKCKSGTMTALLGASGAGKTTLLNFISGRLLGGVQEGEVFLNGVASAPALFRKVSAFVTQDDIVPNALSAREILGYTAELRLPELDAAGRKARVDQVLETLRISHRADTVVGTPGLVRGLSGGERKRVNIANSLISDPSLLFLDEPTTGLDSETSALLCQELRGIAEKGVTILSTIHQPSAEILNEFDVVMLMSKGRLIYNGPPDRIVEYFADLGFHMSEYENPADFMVKIASVNLGDDEIHENDEETGGPSYTYGDDGGDYSQDYSYGDDYSASSSYNYSYEDDGGAGNKVSPAGTDGGAERAPAGDRRVRKLISAYDKSDMVESSSSLVHSSLRPIAMKDTAPIASVMKQTKILTRRSLVLVFRNRSLTTARMIEMVLIGVLGGFIFYQTKHDQRGVTTLQGALFILVVEILVSSMIGILNAIPADLPVFFRERSDGSYGSTAYILAKFFADLPGSIFFPFVFNTISYWLIGLKYEAEAFFILCLTLFGVALCGNAIGTLVSSATGDVKISLTVAPALIPMMFVFSGFLRNLDAMTDVLSWIRFINPMKYALASLYFNEFRDSTFHVFN